MFLAPDGQLLSQNVLAARLGVLIPDDFCRIWSAYRALVSPEKFEPLAYYVFTLFPSIPPEAHGGPNVPPEVRIFGRIGADGGVYGYLVHAPECPADDYPVGIFVAIDHEGFLARAPTTRPAFELLLAQRLQWNLENPADPQPARAIEVARELATTLGLTIERRRIPRGRPFRPKLPAGWRHVPTLDGVGALAPADAFARKPHPGYRRPTPLAAPMAAARDALRAGLPGTALALARDVWTNHWGVTGVPEELGPILIAAYTALGRPAYATIVQRQVEIAVPWNKKIEDRFGPRKRPE
ncbi:MAG TPA: hypothetical protein VEA69_24620 [Tepidisphaeraceae bacterium]|nr:hypothetical protein [Tepidisphaeraceae bacterium]